jgi:SPP1 gp7 family putative phage head morphogenesis protein
MLETPMAESTGIVARTINALRYAVTGSAPEGWFPPGDPLPDQAPPDVKGRAFDYDYYVNVDYRPRHTERISFATLKALAASCEPLQMVMNRQRDLVKAIEWTVKPRVETDTKSTDTSVAQIMQFLERPDGQHDWAQWIGAVLDQVFVYDALSIYARPNNSGGLFGLEIIDGSTITPLVDYSGRTPFAPEPAYQQIIKGLPAVHYTTDELLYYPENYRVDHIYGCSRVEQIIRVAETQIARAKSQLGFFTHGNIGDGYFTAPPTYNPDQVRALEKSWNNQMMGSQVTGLRLADRKQVPVMPEGLVWHPTKVDVFQEMFDEWLIRLICFQFGVAPSPFIKQSGMGHGGAGTDKEAAEEAGIAQLMKFIARLMNRIIKDKFQRPDLEFAWVEDREMDPKVASEIDDRRLRNGSRTIDEVRDRNGEDPLPNKEGAIPLIYTTQGAVRLEDAIKEPTPVVAPPKPVPEIDPALAAPAIDPATQAALPAPGKPAAPLAKAADHKAVAAVQSIIGKYLSAQAIVISEKLANDLGLAKSEPSSEDYSGRIETSFDEVDWDWSGLATAVEPLIAGVAVAAGTKAVSDLGLFDAETLKLVSARATAWAHERAAELVGMKWVEGELVDNPNAEWSISSATRNMLRSSVEGAMERGASNNEIAAEIRDNAAFSADRAMTVARTETATADVQGSIAGWRESGLVEGRQWLASDNCCDLCQEIDGTVVGIDEEFPDGDAPLHPNCECSEIPVLSALDDGTGAADGEEE